MILCGIQEITSKKTNQKFMRLHFIERLDTDDAKGSITSQEFVPYDTSLWGLIDSEVKVYYRKSYNGSAVVDAVVPV
jgi:hypothetical protein